MMMSPSLSIRRFALALVVNLSGTEPVPPSARAGKSVPRITETGWVWFTSGVSLPQSPPITSAKRVPNARTCQPAGIGPSSEETSRLGKRS